MSQPVGRDDPPSSAASPSPMLSPEIAMKLREEPLLGLLIEQQEKPYRGVALIEHGTSQEVEDAARLFLKTSERCFRKCIEVMDLEDTELESDLRLEERRKFLSILDDMLGERTILYQPG